MRRLPTSGYFRHLMKDAAALVLVVLCALGHPGVVHAREVLFLTLEYPPYSSEAMPGGGAMIEALTQALEGTEWKVKFKFLPWLRAAHEVKAERADGAVLLWPDEIKQFGVLPTKPVFVSRLGFFVPVTDWDSLNVSLGALRGKRVCTVRGYGYPVELLNAGIVRDDANDDEANLNRIRLGRCDLVALERAVGQYLLAKNFSSKPHVKWKEPAFATVPLVIGVRQTLDDSAKLLADIENGLAKIRKSGRYKAIVNAYSLDAPSSHR